MIAITLVISACSDDNSTNPGNSDLRGTWYGEYFTNVDTLKFTCTTDLSGNTNITGIADLYYAHYYVPGDTMNRRVSRVKGNIAGQYNKPDLYITSYNDSFKYFEGQINEDKTALTGIINIPAHESDSVYKFNVILNKQN